MEHFISTCTKRGNGCQEAARVELHEAMKYLSLPEMAGEEKSNCVLIFNGYSNATQMYSRLESSFTHFSTIFVDCDNPNSDANLMESFKEVMDGYEYYLYETYSSTSERPKFRAIIPMDRELAWSKAAKTAIFQTFSKFADAKASWFYSPTRNKVATFIHHEGRLFPSRIIENATSKIEHTEQNNMTMAFLEKARRYAMGNEPKRSEDSWRHLPSVKHCLSGLIRGERDSSICKACYALDKLGYREHIREFIDELDVPREFKAKFRAKYNV